MTEIILDHPIIHMRNRNISYCMQILPDGTIMHLHFGKRLEAVNPLPLMRHSEIPHDGSYHILDGALENTPQEYPSFGMGDRRPGACAVRSQQGSRSLVLRYVSAEVLEGKPKLPGLPASFGDDCKTLILTAQDTFLGLTVKLQYSIFADCDIVVRSVFIENNGSQTLFLEKALSLCLDLPDSDFDLLTLSGRWAQERTPYRRPIAPGSQGVRSRIGASSHTTSPFAALLRRDTTEEAGEVYAAAFVYSGNFQAEAHVDIADTTRLLLGLDGDGFRWKLEPGQSFQTPEAVLTYSDQGLTGMSHQFHRFCNRHLARGEWARKPRPVLLNNWEGTYFDFTEEKLLAMGKEAADLGVELFVLDDGWFGKRNADNCSLGDWYVNREKLPSGLDPLIEKLKDMGLAFGLWMEPEMISPDSDLYRAHPDWAIQIPGREQILRRNQLILDLSRPEVCEYIYGCVANLLKNHDISYVKWDMNRDFDCIGSNYLDADRQGELPHRYMLGLYGILERLTAEFPHVLFEGCAGGGGRFDLGMLHYFPQSWCSDDTDPICRLTIQTGTSYVFPMHTMGAHVSASSNHQTGRATPMETRFGVAMFGAFGYELDPTALGEGEKETVRRQIRRYKNLRGLLFEGELYRLSVPRHTAWMSVLPDRSRAVLLIVRPQAQTPHVRQPLIRLRGLDPQGVYQIQETGDVYSGSQLQGSGLCMRLPSGDAACGICTLKKVN